jgi:hypothetical protein
MLITSSTRVAIPKTVPSLTHTDFLTPQRTNHARELLTYSPQLRSFLYPNPHGRPCSPTHIPPSVSRQLHVFDSHLLPLLLISAEGVAGAVSVRTIGKHAVLASSVWMGWMMFLSRMKKKLLLIVPVEHCQKYVVSWGRRRGSHSLVQMGSTIG